MGTCHQGGPFWAAKREKKEEPDGPVPFNPPTRLPEKPQFIVDIVHSFSTDASYAGLCQRNFFIHLVNTCNFFPKTKSTPNDLSLAECRCSRSSVTDYSTHKWPALSGPFLKDFISFNGSIKRPIIGHGCGRLANGRLRKPPLSSLTCQPPNCAAGHNNLST